MIPPPPDWLRWLVVLLGSAAIAAFFWGLQARDARLARDARERPVPGEQRRGPEGVAGNLLLLAGRPP